MKAGAAYIRVSTDDQVEFSPESQRKALIGYADRNDIYLPNSLIFVDEGISGKTTKKRPEFNRMIALAKTKPKPFDVILVWKFSRFARNREDSVVYKSMLRRELGIDVVSISESVGDDKMSILFEAMIEAMDEYYSINLAEEVKRGMTEKAKRGGVLSIPPFGYKVENGDYVVVDDEAEIIKKVFADYAHGDGFLKIAKRLNALGVRTHRGCEIENRTIEYWLNNPTYIGKTRWNPAGKTSRDYHNPNIILSDSTHEAIIDQALWNIVQEKIKQQKMRYRKNYTSQRDGLSNWCVGLARCGICGAALANMSGSFQCSKKAKGTCPGNGTISVRKLNKIVLEMLEQFFDGDDEALQFEPLQDSSVEHPSVVSDIDILKKELDKAEFRLARAKEAYETGIDTIDEYKHNKNRIQSEINNVREKISSLEGKLKTPPVNAADKRPKIERLLEILKNPNVPEAEKNTVARTFIKEITKTGDDGKTIRLVLWG